MRIIAKPLNLAFQKQQFFFIVFSFFTLPADDGQHAQSRLCAVMTVRAAPPVSTHK
jgi:hypothetical protein